MGVMERPRKSCLGLRRIYIRLGNTRCVNMVDGVLIYLGPMGWR
mgnify:CR=1 FL=1